MSNMDTLINGINPNKKSPNKEALWEFVKETLKLIGEINDYYKKLNEGSDNEAAMITEIEDRYEEIKKMFDDLFAQDVNGKTKSADLLSKIEEIKEYHAELLTDDDSIKKDVEDSQKHITDFYSFLFGDENNEEKTKKAIDAITAFHTKLKSEDGIETEVKEAYKLIVDKHAELFNAPKGQKSKIDDLEESIGMIDTFHKNLEKKLKPELEEQKKFLEELTTDIKQKQGEVGSLLSNATVRTLAQGYMESMQEYSQKNSIPLEKVSLDKMLLLNILKNMYAMTFNHVLRHGKSFFNYLVFILPLIVICLIFIESDLFKDFLQINRDGVTFSGTEFMFYKTMLSLPLLWVAWFGQRNISQRRRLFEEYNHKLRVVQMYMLFTAEHTSYPMSNRSNLEGTLLGAIDSNPAEHLGKGETMLDNLLEKFRLEGFYKKLKKEVMDDVKSIFPNK